jgi:predicted GNAT family N-acyltransferase
VLPEMAQRECWLDEHDATAQHWAFYDGDEPVAAARLSVCDVAEKSPDYVILRDLLTFPLPSPIATINRMVVHPDLRGQGLSEKLDILRLEAAEWLGCRCVVASAYDTERIGQLEKFGFVYMGREGIPNDPVLTTLGCFSLLFCPLPRCVSMDGGVYHLQRYGTVASLAHISSEHKPRFFNNKPRITPTATARAAQR